MTGRRISHRSRFIVALAAVLIVVAACSTSGSGAPPSATTPPPAGASASPGAPVSQAASATAVSATAAPTTAPSIAPARGSSGAAAGTAAPATASAAPSATASPARSATPAPAALGWRKLRAGSAPAAREDQTWTVDEAGRFAYLFGGRDGATVFGDLWRYDLKNDGWTELQPKGSTPDARFGHAAAWIPNVGLAIFAGQAGQGFFNDVWVFDPGPGTWRRFPSAGATPEPRYGSCGAVGPDGRLWISHGFTDRGRFSDTRAYDFTAKIWADVSRDDPVPVIRCLHDCLWTADGRLLLYGGQTNGVAALGDLWQRTATGDWAKQNDPPLPARQLYAVAVTAGRAWIFGGGNIDRKALGDLWTLDLATLAWHEESLAAGPPARLSATLIADPSRGRLLLFGGRTDAGALADLWQLTV